MSDDIPVFPVTRWDFGPVPTLGFVIFRPHFLSGPMQDLEAATAGRRYALTAVQCRALAEDLLQAAHQLQTTGQSSPPGPKH